MLDVRYKSDKRDAGLHHGHWLLKAGLWLACNALPFFLPVGVVGAYSWLARFGSPLFLLIQMVILLVGAAPRAAPAAPSVSLVPAEVGCTLGGLPRSGHGPLSGMRALEMTRPSQLAKGPLVLGPSFAWPP